MKKNYYKIAIERYFSTPVPYFLIGTVPLMLSVTPGALTEDFSAGKASVSLR